MAQIDKPNLHFNTKLYTGNGGTQSITGVGFQPDWIWIKCRSNADDHTMTDVVRGNTKVVYPNGPAAEGTSSIRITSFDSDGFSLGSSGDTNSNSRTFASWNWKAGGSAVTNNVGDLTSSVSCNNAAGISIITWTGDGVGGNVGTGFTGTETIGFATCKKLSTSSEWQTGVYGAYSSNPRNFAYHLELNSTSALSGSGPYMLTSQTSGDPTKLKLASEGYVNGVTYVAYVFKPVKGFSKFGSYTGNGNADGAFIYTGFKPAWLMYKITSGADNWQMLDNKRNSFNVMDKNLFANLTNAETASSNYNIDFVSNGFKLRNSHSSINGSGSTYIYMAFAENPIVGSNNIPATAR